jgi:hypothetical protein
VERGALLAKLYVRRTEDAETVRARVRGAFAVGERPEAVPDLVRGRIG